MGQDGLTPSSPRFTDHQHEQRLREQLHESFRLARELDERVRSIPPGKLSHFVSDQNEGAAASSSGGTATPLRCSIAIATADVVAAFNKSIKLLLQSSDCSPGRDYPTATSAAGSPLQTALQYASPRHKAPRDPCVPFAYKAANLVAEQTKSPPHSPAARQVKASSVAAAHYKQQYYNMACASPTASSPRMMTSSPLLSATSDMSDGSPKPTQLDLPGTDEATTAITMNPVICRKRKLQPKVTLKMPAGSAETAENNAPPDDGHTWRKYGQKNILGALYPRSYYRCTHKTDTGCPALKQVQRCDEEDLFFEVVYKGYHTCRSAELDQECWPLAFPQGMLHFPPKSRSASLPPSAGASLMLTKMNAASSTLHASVQDGSLQLPFTWNPELPLTTQPLTPRSANLLNHRSHPYQFHGGRPLQLSIMNSSTGPAPSSDHSLFRNSSAAIQDESAGIKDELGSTPTNILGPGDDGLGKETLYNVQKQGRAVNPLEDWESFENNNGEMYKRLTLVSSYADEAIIATHAHNTSHDHGESQPLIYGSRCNNLPEQDVVANALDNDDDVLGYLDP